MPRPTKNVLPMMALGAFMLSHGAAEPEQTESEQSITIPTGYRLVGLVEAAAMLGQPIAEAQQTLRRLERSGALHFRKAGRWYSEHLRLAIAAAKDR